MAQAELIATKTCSKCREDKPASEFAKDRSSSDGLQRWCKPCRKAYQKTWYENNAERERAKRRAWWDEADARTRRDFNLVRKYGITEAQFLTMLVLQDSQCAICHRDFGQHKADLAHVDHCHVTGNVRQLLCRECNVGLGHFKDQPNLLREAALYLERHV